MTGPANTRRLRRLIIVLGDQLDRDSPLLQALDARQDMVFMAEVREEATHVWSHKARIALFLAAMRHFREDLLARGIPLHYLALESHTHATLSAALDACLKTFRPQQLLMQRAGDWRVQQALTDTASRAGLRLEIVENPRFLVTLDEFRGWLGSRKQPRMEHF